MPARPVPDRTSDDPVARSLWVTNDFPPRSGGIEQMLSHLVATLPPEGVRVIASPWAGDVAHDATQPYIVQRVHRRPLLPTPGVLRTVRRAVAAHGAEVVVFGSAWPLAELAAHLDVPTLGITHGREAGMVRWGVAPLIRRLGRGCTSMTLLSDYTAARLHPILDQLTGLHRLPGGVDTATFRPEGPTMRERYGLEAATPVVVCISRLVARKGQDTLVRVWPQVRQAVPGAHLLIVGTGPLEPSLRTAVDRSSLGGAVTFAGEVPWVDLPAHYRTGDVFAMPCRTRLGGMDVEGLGLVFLEAQACGVPVVVGDSGGAPQTVLDGTTGLVVDGHDDVAVADAIIAILGDRQRAGRMGTAARRHAQRSWDWSVIGASLRDAINATAIDGRAIDSRASDGAAIDSRASDGTAIAASPATAVNRAVRPPDAVD
ncbi:MAG TPA: glycosyltransferase family 4 protein [Euzebya sp.]|nr:glycosyltransferase family 4 protein [Euzebya sp.]